MASSDKKIRTSTTSITTSQSTADVSAQNIFKPFTPESYQRLQEREIHLKATEIKRARHAQEAHLVDGQLKFGAQDDDEVLPPENPDLRDGATFTTEYGKVPRHLMGRPLEELDPGIREKTFVIIASRFRKKCIYRFTATKALFILPPWNPIRRLMLRIATFQLFDVLIFLTIVINCVFLAQPYLPISETAEYVFLAIYSTECVIKVLARGFMCNNNTYLRDPWNWLDFVVIFTAYTTLMLQFTRLSVTVGNVQGLRTFRVLRALKTVSIVPGLKTIVNALLRAFKMLFEVILLTMFCLMVFAIFGLQIFMGVLRRKCVHVVTGYVNTSYQTYSDYYDRWIRDPNNWYPGDNDNYVVCGNASGTGICPDDYVCLPHIGDNPNHGYLNFDHIGWALLSCFQLVTLDFWEDNYNKVIRATGPWYLIFYIIIIFFGSFYLINLILAVVSMSYEEEAVSAGKEKEREKKEKARTKHSAMYDPQTTQMQDKTEENAKDTTAQEPTTNEQLSESAEKNTNYNARSSKKKESTPKLDKNPIVLQHLPSIVPDADTNRNDHEIYTPGKFKRVQTVPSHENCTCMEAAISCCCKLPQMAPNPIGLTENCKPQGILIIKADTLLDPEIGKLEGQVIDRNCYCCEKWMWKYVQLLRIQNNFYVFVSDPLFDLTITFCIVLNTFFMALEHHNQPVALTNMLVVANYVFTGVFCVEAVCKIVGLGKYYFIVKWNIFDLVIVLASVLDLCLEQIDGLSVLRTFRLLRVLKLAQSWPTMRLLLTIIFSTLGALGNLCLILGIVIYIFAVIGLQLFRDQYTVEKMGPNVRWNFKDFVHSMLMIFRVLCGEWIEPLYQCMKASDELCMVVFLPALVFGNFIVLNLFLALLLNAFASDSLDRQRESNVERSKLSDGFQRLKQLLCCCCPRLMNGKVEPSGSSIQNSSQGESTESPPKVGKEDVHSKSVSFLEGDNLTESSFNQTKNANGIIKSEGSVTNDSRDPKKPETSVEINARDNTNNNNNTAGEHNHQMGDEEDEFSGTVDDAGPLPDCFPSCVSKRSTCFNALLDTTYGRRWLNFRTIVKKVVDHRVFETVVLVIIMGSSLTLAFEDVYLYQKKELGRALYICNIFFATLFTIEMIFKIIGFGLTEYFTSFWTILDFVIVIISLSSLIGDYTGMGNITAFRSLRTLRALRPLRAISRWQGMKIVVNALLNAIPAIFNVFLVCMVFWLIFSIMGVQFFKGRFFKCTNPITSDNYSPDVVPDRNTCTLINGSWENSNVNFDNAAIGFLALFQVATFEGWMEIMADAIDSTEINKQPRFEANLASYSYFVVFIIFGSFFSLNLFIGVIIDNFNVLKKRYEGSYLDAFLTTNQRNYYNTLKKLSKKKPQKTIKRPKNQLQLFFYNLSMSSKFEMSIVLLIFCNMITMAIEHYKQPKSVAEGLDMMNILFTTVFFLEAVVKIIGLRFHYFRFIWNIFDFLIVCISILELILWYAKGIFVSKILSNLFVTPTLLRVIRVFRIGRVLRLIKAAKGIRKLLFALIISLPAIFNIGALLFLVMYIYAIIGMSSFGNVRVNGVMDEITNFQTFGNSFMLLLRLSTSAGWNDILESLLIKTPYCDPHYYTQPDGVKVKSATGDCGIPYLAIPYMVTYIIIAWLIVINMYIAVILENFNQAHEQEEVGITEDDFDMFYMVWEKYDPHATQFIKYEQLADFVNDLEQPLKIPKPNEIALVSFNIPIMEGEKIHCLDILVALVRNVLTEVEETDELVALKSQMETKFAQNFPSRVNITVKSTTLQRKKEDVAARTLQRSWRSFKAQRAMRNITALAVQQRIRRVSHVGMRARTNVMRTLGNRLTAALSQYFSSQKLFAASEGSELNTESEPASISQSKKNNAKL